jgi:hypothetical protein
MSYKQIKMTRTRGVTIFGGNLYLLFTHLIKLVIEEVDSIFIRTGASLFVLDLLVSGR